MGRFAARFVVCTHVNPYLIGEKDHFEPAQDDSDFCVYDMERYGINLGIIGGTPGTSNDMNLAIKEKHPGKFAARSTTYFWGTHKDPEYAKYAEKFLKKEIPRDEIPIELCIAEADGWLKTGKFVGVHATFSALWWGHGGKRANNSLREKVEYVRKWYDLCSKYKIPFYFGISINFENIPVLERMVLEYPDVSTEISCYSHVWAEHYVMEACRVIGGATRGGVDNAFLNIGGIPYEYLLKPLADPNVGPKHMTWSVGLGNVYSYRGHPGVPTSCTAFMKDAPHIIKYEEGKTTWQTPPPRSSYANDPWGWSLHQIDKLRDILTQDEINLIMGGNAARIYKLKVPYDRMFSTPIPEDQVIHKR